ncbi:MAG: hypothetical protein A2V83_06240 [Nitrospirae bacterium RBG_16_64_22]|nr:MAG: hypothetical protein A2V83_06240 [Nitrospirae bacterium RBG_16_64_22]
METTASGKTICIGRTSDIPEGEGRAVTIAGKTYAVFRDNDRLYALDNRCPHAGGPLADGMVGGGFVTCPLHGWKVDLKTGAVAGGGEVEVPAVPVMEEEGLIYLEVDPRTADITPGTCACGSR